MLQNLRQHSGGIFAKILFGLIIASFALVGVGDMFQRYSAKPVATVGGTSIPMEEYDYRLKITRDQIIASTQGKAKVEDLKAMGIAQKVAEDMVNKVLIDLELKHLDIVLSDGALEGFIKLIPDFQNKRGQFDKEKFENMMRGRGSKGEFFNALRNDLKKQQFIGTLAHSIQLPKAYQEELYKALQQETIFTVIYIPESMGKVTTNPTDADLEQIYKANPEIFTAPEYRDVSLLVIDPKKLQETVRVSEAQIREEYARRQGDFVVPESRDVIQLKFSSREQAEAAKVDLSAGESLEKVVKKHKAKTQLHEGAVRDKFIASHGDAIYALQGTGVTDPVDSALEKATYIFVVNKINPAGEQPLESVRSQVEEDLKSRLSQEILDDVRNKVEDELAGGKLLSDVATQFHLEVVNVGMVDQKGLSSKKSAGSDSLLPADMKNIVLENAFSLGENSDSSVLDLPNGKMIVVHVGGMKAKVLPELKEIREDVAKYWRESQQREKAAELSLAMVKEINEGNSIAQVAKKNGLSSRVLDAVSRAGLQEKPIKDTQVGLQVLQRGFKQPLQKATYGPAKDGLVVIVPTKVIPLDMIKEKEKLSGFDQSLKLIVQRDLEQDYLKDLKARYKVDINEEAVGKAFTSGE